MKVVLGGIVLAGRRFGIASGLSDEKGREMN